MKLKKKYSPSDITQLICVLYICIWVISPPLAYGVLYRVFVVAATIIWLCIELKNRPRNLLGSSRPTLFVFVFVFYSAIVGYLVEGSTDLIRNFQIYICLLFLVFYESYRKRDIRQLRPVFWISVILLSGWAFLTLIGLNANENVARILVRSSDLAEEYSGQGIGGYGLVYSLIIGVPVALYLVKSGDLLKYMPKKGYFFQACLVFFFNTQHTGYSESWIFNCSNHNGIFHVAFVFTKSKAKFFPCCHWRSDTYFYCLVIYW